MGDIFLKPYKPLARRRTDILTYIVRFVCGCIAGIIIGGFVAIRTHQSQAQELFLQGDLVFTSSFYMTLLGITIVIGIIAMLLGDAFWGMFSGKRSY